MSQNHNLNLQSYSLDEVLGLFDLTTYQISLEEMRRAKKKVLMLHPDKSRMDPIYYHFYREAYAIVLQFYENQNRQNQQITEDTTKYKPLEHGQNKATTTKISETINSMKPKEFHNRFNELFEQNEMIDRPDPKRNDWFVQENAIYSTPEGKVSEKNIGQHFEEIKKQNAAITKYRGVQDMISNSSTNSSSLYDDQNDTYVSSDPFSKLKFDDLRKVHKDQTIFAVSENDFKNVQTYKSVDEFNRARSQYSYDPIEKEKAQKMLDDQERITREQMMRQQYDASIKSQQYIQKNQTVLSNFLQLRN
jgi:hypothetical protein